MPPYQVLFWDGPCAKQVKTIEFPFKPPISLQCGGATYERGTPASASVQTYVVVGGKFNPSAAEIRGQRDVFQAWHRLMSTLENSQKRRVRRLRAASHRIRRAVR